MTFGITALGVGLGAVFPRFKHENVAQIPTGFGGIVYMLVTMLFIGSVILLEAWPVYRIFTSKPSARQSLCTDGWRLSFPSQQSCSSISWQYTCLFPWMKTAGTARNIRSRPEDLSTTYHIHNHNILYMLSKNNTLPCYFSLYKPSLL